MVCKYYLFEFPSYIKYFSLINFIFILQGVAHLPVQLAPQVIPLPAQSMYFPGTTVLKNQCVASSSNACKNNTYIPTVEIGVQFGDKENDALYAEIANEVENAWLCEEQGKIYNIID